MKIANVLTLSFAAIIAASSLAVVVSPITDNSRETASSSISQSPPSQWSKKQLIEYCKKNSLKTSGSHEELVIRVQNHLRTASKKVDARP
ncbi:SAP domain-containing new25 [Schizosaccharomyces pombe]|uniref:SAP domain-containing new25 n=1 Tax=Schizosaccharomyces pombe (strain 972 / ATCC 24843) TaxID=284812 RepID=NEW25_SCHPO|nr:protein new25 [Schizosaccharomyces pombe]G2TRT4.1 RecName: Full=SAP domain-containing new25 [Schizosaccharomyces pombe 972h-]CCD31388.1 sequence orphan [Schizosaccharomyces pombe]|eukprot:NP_001343178.1 protein new25 [Schizosaccharomyces pombe]